MESLFEYAGILSCGGLYTLLFIVIIASIYKLTEEWPIIVVLSYFPLQWALFQLLRNYTDGHCFII